MTIGGNAVALKQTQNGTETHERGSGNVADDVFDLDNTIGYGSGDGNGGDYDDDLMFQLLSQFESKFPVSASGGPSSAPNSCAPAAPSLTQPSVISVATAAAMTSTITGTNLHRPALIQHQYSLPGSPHCQTKRAPPLQQQALIHQSHNNSVTGDDLVRLRRQIASVQQEKRALMMEKLSKEGEVTIVRNRLIQIEGIRRDNLLLYLIFLLFISDENKQLRNQINQVSTQQQQQIRNVESKFQRELELMRTQLLFQVCELLSYIVL
jgi:hypothetical protein